MAPDAKKEKFSLQNSRRATAVRDRGGGARCHTGLIVFQRSAMSVWLGSARLGCRRCASVIFRKDE